MKLKRVLLNNAGIKILALLLALLTWLYVGEATKEISQRTVLQKLFSPSSYITKKLYVKPVFRGEVPEGYIFRESEVTVTPEFLLVMGPSRILAKRELVFTEPIDLPEYTKSKTIDVGLQDVSRAIRFQKMTVRVSLNIQKVGTRKIEK